MIGGGTDSFLNMGMRLNGLRKAKVIIDRMILESSEFAERDVVVLHGVQWNDIAGDELYLGDGTPLEIREWTGRTRMHNGFRLDEAVFSIGFDRWRGFLPAPDFRSKHGMSPSEVMCDSPLVLHRIVDSVETGGVVLREGYVKGLRKAQHLLREQLDNMTGGGFLSEDEMTAIVKDGTKETGLYEIM